MTKEIWRCMLALTGSARPGMDIMAHPIPPPTLGLVLINNSDYLHVLQTGNIYSNIKIGDNLIADSLIVLAQRHNCASQ